MKDDYIIALRNHFIKEKFGSKENIPWSLAFMLSIETPQLCRRIKDLKEAQQQLVLESDDWIAECNYKNNRLLAFKIIMQ